MSTADTLRALRFLEAHLGALRKNSTAYRRIASEIRSADNPMTVARQRLQSAHRVRERERHQGLIGLAHELLQRQGFNTATLDAVVAELRRGFHGGRLDPQHHAMIEALEASIFAKTTSPDDLLALIEQLVKIAAYDHRRACWHTYRATLNSKA